MNTELIAPLLYLCQDGGQRFTGIDIGPVLSVYPTRTNQLQSQSCLLFEHGSMKELPVHSIVRQDGRLLLLIVEHKCLSCLAFFETQDSYEATERVLEIVDALNAHSMPEQLFVNGMVMSSIILLEESGFILLSGKLADFQRSLLPPEEKFLCFEKFHNPALAGQTQLSFALAVKIYQLAFGQVPYTGKRSEYTHNMIHGNGLASSAFVLLKERAIQEQFDALIEARLASYRFADLKAFIEQVRLVSLAQIKPKEEILAESANPFVKRYKSRQRFIRFKNSLNEKKILVASLSVFLIFVVSVLWSMISPNFREPLTIGLDAHDLVYAYFQAFDDFDGDFLRDALSNDEEAKVNDYITSLFVLERLRIVSDGIDTRMPIERWLELKKPLLHSKIVLFGSHNFKIVRERVLSEQRFEFEVVYDFYNNLNQNASPESLELSKVSIERRHELLELKKIEVNRWEITKIDRLNVELLE